MCTVIKRCPTCRLGRYTGSFIRPNGNLAEDCNDCENRREKAQKAAKRLARVEEAALKDRSPIVQIRISGQAPVIRSWLPGLL